jgi:hypothetical protein
MLLCTSIFDKNNKIIDVLPYNDIITEFVKKYPNLIDIYGSNLINYEWFNIVTNMDNVIYEKTCLKKGDETTNINFYSNLTDESVYKNLGEYIDNLLNNKSLPVNNYEKNLKLSKKELKFNKNYKEYKWEISLNAECIMNFLNNILKEKSKTFNEALEKCGFEIKDINNNDFFTKIYNLYHKITERYIIIYVNEIPEHSMFELKSDITFDIKFLGNVYSNGAAETKDIS